MNVLLFELHNNRYAVPAEVVMEIVRAVALVPIASAPRGVEGVFSLRGRVIPVVDVRTRFGLPSKGLDPAQHFVVVTIDGHWVALRVDCTDALRTVDETQFEASIEDMRQTVSAASDITGVVTLDDGLVVIYDVSAFLSYTEAKALGALLDTMMSPTESSA